MMGLLLSDARKIKGTWIPWLLLVAPIGFSLLQVVNYMTRPEILKPLGWVGLMAQANYFWPVVLILGFAIATSMVAGMEHDASSWKVIFSLPINKFSTYVSKFFLLLIYIIGFVFLTLIGLLLVGLLFSLGPIKWSLVLEQLFYPCLAGIPVLALQLWISMIFHNQALSITVGIIGAMLCLFLAYSSVKLFNILPWAYIPLASPLNKGEYMQWPLFGVIIGVFLLIIGGIHFSKREL
ncbi:hypothetical protein SAMN05444487_11383 [Marininema mesophilum]|uniref:ABC-2 type transport system permease protein n=1 Tax=Marininema mesophilum TaxID=1048340 RepID=A0A1H3AHX2_9BACL|nr:ABC transporter permease [Marininema mesophilum]SDX28938.1 hypothetical protein SAMN05444487_11383 [Marininema mesophilum]